MKNRISAIQGRLRKHGADAVWLSFLPDVRWACGFTGSNGLLIVGSDAAHFLSDGRYAAQAHREVEDASVHIPEGSLIDYAAEKQLIGEGDTALFQADHVTVAKRETFGEKLSGVQWEPVSDFLVESVAAKEAYEVERVRGAQAITEDVFDYLCGFIAPGQTERAIASEIVYQHLKRGAERMSFDPIVASGPNSSLPHARPTNRKLRNGDMVVIDMGGVVDGYASDMTRTIAVGHADDEARAHYDVVLDAQERAIAAAHAGMTGKELDAVARSVIENAGLGAYFSHSLGHGIGLQTHEWPRLSQRVEHTLPEGATVTIEPGVYVREQHGIRIEDIVVLRADGCENLTTAPKGLMVL